MTLNRITAVLVTFLLSADLAGAAELTVGPGQMFAKIQDAVDAAAVAGDTIRVFPGIYSENVFVVAKDVEIFSDSDDYTDTIIDGSSGSTSVVRLVDGSDGSLEGFTIQQGTNSAGGGAFIYLSSPRVRNCRFRQNTGEFGAGMAIVGGAPTIEDCRFTQNSAITMTVGTTPAGGGVYVEQSLALFQDCRVDSNSSAGDGGGVAARYNLNNGPTGATFLRCVIELNHAWRGGGVAARDNTTVSFVRCEIIDNLADLAPGAGNSNNGGGVFSRDACPQLTSCLIARNKAGNAAVTGRVGRGGGVFQRGFGTVIIDDEQSLCETVVQNCTIADNDAGITSQNGGFGGGLYNDQSLTFLRNSILWGNVTHKSSASGNAIAVFNSPPALGGTFVTASYCDLPGGGNAVYEEVPGVGNYVSSNVLHANPQFAGGGDYHLLATSPAIDAGDPALPPEIGSFDLDGDPRLLSTTVDMGADEFVDCAIVTTYGPLTPNSAGPGAMIALGGSTSVSANDAILQVTGAPPASLGIFLYGPAQQIVPFDEGNLLVGGVVVRLSAVVTDGSGSASLPVDWSSPPFNGPPNPVIPGSSWNFQFWFRDIVGGQNTSNLSNAMHVTFCP